MTAMLSITAHAAAPKNPYIGGWTTKVENVTANIDVFDNGNFIEAPHTAGRANLVELVRIFEKQDPTLPFRVDHGKTMLGDEKVGYNPGYSFHGRMLALGQVEGMMAAVRDEIKNQLI